MSLRCVGLVHHVLNDRNLHLGIIRETFLVGVFRNGVAEKSGRDSVADHFALFGASFEII